MNNLHPRMGIEQVESLATGKPPVADTLKQELTEALRECLSHYCPGCGFGDEGCATIHHIKCSYLALLEKAEGRELKLNMEPANEEVPF